MHIHHPLLNAIRGKKLLCGAAFADVPGASLGWEKAAAQTRWCESEMKSNQMLFQPARIR
jgi:hypothetical protein